ncbi:hypothetical protein [Methylobacterium sp. A54F]
MRVHPIALATVFAALLATASAPAAAQGLSATNPNSYNDLMARQGEIRTLQQNFTSDLNTLRYQNQRAVQFRQPDEIYGGPVLLRSGRGVRASGLRGAGSGIRAARPRGGLDTGICVGC